MSKVKVDKVVLKNFGITMGAAFLVVAIVIALRHGYAKLFIPALLSTIFFILAFAMPILLKPIYIIWMKFAFILSWLNTRLLLMAIFYLIFTPIGVGMRLFGFDVLEKKIKKERQSYWQKKEKAGFNPFDYERQF